MTATPDIFLSYNREDAEVARRFAEGFEAEGSNVWWDQALRSGEAYDEVTEAALRSAKAVVVLWSKKSVVSRWVRAEASIADENGTLVPAMIEACSLPVMFRLTQTADLSGWQGASDDKTWLAFLGDVRRMVGKQAPETTAKPGPAPAPAGSGVPIVAVLPITLRGKDEELEFLAEDLTEEITRELARSGRFKVTAASVMAALRGKEIDYRGLRQDLNANYFAEGKMQRGGENIRLTVQLIDASTADMVWSGRYVRNFEELEASPEELVRLVVTEINESVLQIGVKQAMAKSGPYTGWEHLLRAVAYLNHLSSDSTNKAIEEARQAVTAAPDLGQAHALLSLVLSTKVNIQGEELDEILSNEIQTHISRAMQLDASNSRVIGFVASAYGALGNDEASLRLARRALELDPHSSFIYSTLGYACARLGRVSDAVAAFEHLDRVTSHSVVSGYQGLSGLGMCYLLDGRPNEARDALNRSLALNPDYHHTLKWKAIVSAQQGNDDDAIEAIRRLRKIEPGMSIEDHTRQMLVYKGLKDRMAEPVATLRRLWEETGGDK